MGFCAGPPPVVEAGLADRMDEAATQAGPAESPILFGTRIPLGSRPSQDELDLAEAMAELDDEFPGARDLQTDKPL